MCNGAVKSWAKSAKNHITRTTTSKHRQTTAAGEVSRSCPLCSSTHIFSSLSYPALSIFAILSASSPAFSTFPSPIGQNYHQLIVPKGKGTPAQRNFCAQSAFLMTGNVWANAQFCFSEHNLVRLFYYFFDNICYIVHVLILAHFQSLRNYQRMPLQYFYNIGVFVTFLIILLPCDDMHSAAIAGMRCPSVRPSVTFVSCAKTN